MAGRRLLRLDAELVRRGLARSREQAAALIAAGRVEVRGVLATKSATAVDPETPVRVLADDADPGFASRGGFKLNGALERFALPVAGRRCLDAGASTGGFTDVLLRGGAESVAAVDVGYGQLAWALRTDPRVRVYDRTNVRALTPADIGGQVSLTVADLSFISLKLVLPALISCTESDGDLVPMVKPQFEVGKDRLGRGGVVRDPVLHSEAVFTVAETAASLGWGVRGVALSSLPGPSGNLEFFLWLRRNPAGAAGPVDRTEIDRAVAAAREQGAVGAEKADDSSLGEVADLANSAGSADEAQAEPDVEVGQRALTGDRGAGEP